VFTFKIIRSVWKLTGSRRRRNIFRYFFARKKELRTPEATTLNLKRGKLSQEVSASVSALLRVKTDSHKTRFLCVEFHSTECGKCLD